MTPKGVGAKSRRARLLEVWGFLFGLTQFVVVCIVPHLITIALGGLGISYVVGRSYLLMPSEIGALVDGNYDILSKTTSVSFANYFALFRLSLFYVFMAFTMADLALAIFGNFGSTFIADMDKKTGRTALIAFMIFCPIFFMGSVVIGFLSPDSLESARAIMHGQHVDQGTWWLTFPASVGFGQLFLPLFFASFKHLAREVEKT